MVTLSADGIITLNRGDTVRFPIVINQGTLEEPVRYDLQDRDELYISVAEPNQPFENALIRKKLDMNSLKDKYGYTLFCIDHDDTKCLTPGKYYYQIKLRKYNTLYEQYDVMTIVGETLFWVEK